MAGCFDWVQVVEHVSVIAVISIQSSLNRNQDLIDMLIPELQ